MKFFHQLDRRR